MQVSLSSNTISTSEENKKSNANSLLLTPMVDSPIFNEIVDPRLVLLDVTPPQKPQLMTEEIVPQLIRSSTPALNEYLLSTIENVDEEVNCSSSPSPRPSKMQKDHMTDYKSSKEVDIVLKPITPSTSKTVPPIVDVNFPTSIKQISTPFKKAFFFHLKTKNNHKNKNISKKVTLTVDTASAFIEHQRRIAKEKKEKEKLKQKRK